MASASRSCRGRLVAFRVRLLELDGRRGAALLQGLGPFERALRRLEPQTGIVLARLEHCALGFGIAQIDARPLQPPCWISTLAFAMALAAAASASLASKDLVSS
jgi:hypothetical protein